MTIVLEARKLANYIESLETFQTVNFNREYCYDHMGALFTDIVLQAGLNYKTVVRPRVQNLLLNHPDANTCTKFEELINIYGLSQIIRWQHPEKLRRFRDLLEFASSYGVDSCDDFRSFLKADRNRNKMRMLKGFGPKTIDYTLKLLNFDTVAVDRHIYSFVEMADIDTIGYDYTKKLVEYAADFLEISRSSIDHSIWLFMSGRSTNITTQLSMQI